MQRTIAHRREVRAGNCVPVSDHSTHPAKARDCQRQVFGQIVRAARAFYSSRQKRSGFQIVCSRCKPSYVAFLHTFFQGGLAPRYDQTRRPRTNPNCRSWSNSGWVDRSYKRAIEVMTHFANFGGNWNNGANSGSRNVASDTATVSDTAGGSRGVCDHLTLD